jgi:hypothetical protein
MDNVLKTPILKRFYKIFQAREFASPLKQKGFQKLQDLLKAPMIGVQIPSKTAVPIEESAAALPPAQSLSPLQWFLICSIAVWTFTLMFSNHVTFTMPKWQPVHMAYPWI